jgi:SRSO17 transposase
MISQESELPAPPVWDALAQDFEAFHARFASLFARSEPREEAVKYIRALMGATARRNGWQLAEALGDRTPDRVQRLLYAADWNADAARDRLIDFAIERFGDPQGIAVLDETGFLKKGTESVGVARQYSGTAGKIENCQIGVFLSYSSHRGHVLLDRRLYLPDAWFRDPARMQRAHVPDGISFQTKPQLALEMLKGAWLQGLPTAWVTGDEVYGDDPVLRDGIAAEGYRYVLAVGCATPTWANWPEVSELPTEPGRRTGRPRTRRRLAAGAPRASTVKQVVAQWSPTHWQRLAVHLGEKGPIEFDWACARVVDSRRGLPSEEVWLLARRSISNPSEVLAVVRMRGILATKFGDGRSWRAASSMPRPTASASSPVSPPSLQPATLSAFGIRVSGASGESQDGWRCPGRNRWRVHHLSRNGGVNWGAG